MVSEMCLVEVHIIKRIEGEIKYLLMKRAEDDKYPGVWQMVTGHIEPNETAIETAVREAFEETGARLTNLLSIPHINSYYNPQTNSVCMIPVFVTEVDKAFEPILSKEHSEFHWVNNEEASKLVAWPGQRKSIELIDEFFNNSPSAIRLLNVF